MAACAVRVPSCRGVIKKRDKGTVQGTRGRFYCLMDIEEQKFRLGDNDAKELIKKLSGCNKMSELQLLERAQRD